MTADEILKRLCEDLKPELEKMLKHASLECCSWCELEVPFDIVGVMRKGEITRKSGGEVVSKDEGWMLTRGSNYEESAGVMRDYTGWARLRMSYVNPEEKKNIKQIGDKAANGDGVTYRVEDRRILVCPSCLETSGLLTAKYFGQRTEGTMPEFIDPDPEHGLCPHGGNEETCPGCKKEPCPEKHYPGVVCGTCKDWQG